MLNLLPKRRDFFFFFPKKKEARTRVLLVSFYKTNLKTDYKALVDELQ